MSETTSTKAGFLTCYYGESLLAGRLTRCDFSDGRYRLTSYEGQPGQDSAEDDGDVGRFVPFYQVERATVASGRLPEALVRKLLGIAGDQDDEDDADTEGRDGKDRKRHKKRDSEKELEVEIAWQTLRMTSQDDDSHGLCDAVLSLPACVGSDGLIRLAAKGMRMPMMPRALLADGSDAGGRESALLLGNYEAFRVAAEHASRQADEIDKESDTATQWKEYLSIAQACFNEVVNTETLQESLAQLGLALDIESEFVQVCPARVNATRQLELLYESISKSEEQDLPALYNDLLSTKSQAWRVPDFTTTVLEHMVNHCGTIDREHCLSPSQRRALWCFLDGDEGSTLAVSGPPGTGKTTLLKAMVADTLVRRALENAEACAPIIVGTSTNNQAVTNIIDTFGSVGRGETGVLFRRWLPDPDAVEEDADAPSQQAMHGIGCFLPSAARRKRAVDAGYYVSGSYAMDGVFGDCLEESYCARAWDLYDKWSSSCLGSMSAHDALVLVDGLRKKLITTVWTGAGQNVEVAMNGINLFLNKLGGRQLVPEDCATLESLDKALDTKVRPLEFWLAVHQFEQRWLIQAEHIRDERESIKKQQPWANISKKTYFSALANLTPLICMTMFRVPGEFSTWSPKFRKDHMFAGIDLLIADEAGQVSMPVGAAPFALAKRAVAMGDVEQIPPVWSFESDEDERRTEALAKRLQGEVEMPATWSRLRDFGLTASEPSSVMRAAQHRCTYHTALPNGGGYLGGVLLTEHYRCQNTIIEVCNDLSYHGLLEPCCARKVPEDLGLAPLDMVEVRGTCVPRFTSRVNHKEAACVVDWLAQNYERLCDVYPKVDKAEIVGVLTPFRQQAVLIRGLLKKDRATRRFADKVTVGTAHALQGAERRVVLFSLVYDSSSRTGFVDASPNLLNVAVSRAQDSFVVVGDPRVLAKADPQMPLGVLARHLGCNEDGPSHQIEEKKVDGVTISVMLRKAKEDKSRPKKVRERLRTFTAQKANIVLHDLGYLDGTPGSWTVSEEGHRIGMGYDTRQNGDGGSYRAIVFNERAVDIVVDALTR